MARWIKEDILPFGDYKHVIGNESKGEALERILDRLVFGEPVQYIAGHAWFFGYKFKVNQSVLIPRPETEELVDWILKDFKTGDKSHLRILDIGTGSGCIALTLKKELGDQCTVVGIDISKKALEVATENALGLDVQMEWIEIDFLTSDGEISEPFNIIVSNPPYVGKNYISQQMVDLLTYEPEEALYPNHDDIDIFYRKISEWGGKLLVPNGVCYLEINEFRRESIETLFRANIWKNIEIKEDLQGLPRMLKATLS